MSTFRSVVPDSRLIEIIRGYIASQSTETTMPDMRGEIHLLAVARLVVDETRARLPLYELEVRK
jgi:hypothetical protein